MLPTIEIRVAVHSHGRYFHSLRLIGETTHELDMASRHSASIGTVILCDEDVAHLRRQRIHERPALENVRDSLIVRVMSSHELLSVASNLFEARR